WPTGSHRAATRTTAEYAGRVHPPTAQACLESVAPPPRTLPMPMSLPHAAAVAGLLPLLFAACSTPASGSGDLRAVSDGETFAMASGEQVALADRSTLRYVRVTNDSRCKPGRQCVWAGDAEVVFEWT